MTATVHALPVTPAPIVIELLGEPRGKGRPRFVKRSGRTYTPEHTRRYEDMLRIVGGQAMRGRALLEGPLSVRVLADMPVPTSWSRKKQVLALYGEIRPTTKPDADNLLKMLDALNAVVWRDDKQIVELHLRKFYSATPRLCIEVQQL